MLNFLRKIRKKEIKSARYLKYAIGEIVLVVIGILIAVQINNLNQSLKNKKEESFYLLKLRENLQEDLRNIEIKKAQAQRVLGQIEIIIAESRDPEIDSFSVKPTDAMIGLAGMVSQTATWENLKSTGKLSLLQNQMLIDSLYNYYNYYDNSVIGIIDGLRHYTRETVTPFLIQFDDISIQSSVEYYPETPAHARKPMDYSNSRGFRNIARLRILLLSALIERYNEFERLNKGILALIDSELNTD